MSTNNIIEFLRSSIDLSIGDNEHLKAYLESCLEHGAFFYKDNTETIVKTINTSLNNSFDREKGLILLLAFLPQISVEAFSSNALPWMVQCTKVVHQKGDAVFSLGLKALNKLIKLSANFPELSKETAKQIVPKFLLDHVRRRAGSQVPVELLECLSTCMSEYSGPSGEFKADLLRLVLSTVEARPEVVRSAALCVSLVAGVGGGGKQGVSHKVAWQRLQLALMALLHSLLNQIYEHIDCLPDTMVAPPDDVQLVLEPVKERDILRRTQRLATQFSSVAQFLQAMLLEEFPVAKMVAPDAILDVVVHAQRPTHGSLSSSREGLAVVSVLPSVQVAALRLLESLVLCMGRNVVPRGGLVSYLCSQVLVWTQQQQYSDWPYAMDKPYSWTRLAAYSCLCSWLSVVGAATHVDTLVDKAVPVLLADINSEKPTVRLRVGSRTGKGKKKQQMLVSVEDRSDKLGDSLSNRRLCERALLTLTSLVRAASTTLKPETHVSVTDTVLKCVSELPVPYSEANCLSALYQLLLTLCVEPCPGMAPPLAQAVTCFTAGLHHPVTQVKVTCASALSCLEAIIRPTAPTLYFPLPQPRQKPLAREREDSDSEEKETKKLRFTEADRSPSVISIDLIGSEDGSRVPSPAEGKMDVDGSTVGIIQDYSPKQNTRDEKKEMSPRRKSENEDICLEEEKKEFLGFESDNGESALKEKENKSVSDENILVEDKIQEVNIDNEEQQSVEKPVIEDEIQKVNIDNCKVEQSEVIASENQTADVTVAVSTNEQQETEDPEVLRMLMDFKDELNEDTER